MDHISGCCCMSSSRRINLPIIIMRLIVLERIVDKLEFNNFDNDTIWKFRKNEQAAVIKTELLQYVNTNWPTSDDVRAIISHNMLYRRIVINRDIVYAKCVVGWTCIILIQYFRSENIAKCIIQCKLSRLQQY